eukprot:3284726-Ditylum_brightwellii.AAC.1
MATRATQMLVVPTPLPNICWKIASLNQMNRALTNAADSAESTVALSVVDKYADVMFTVAETAIVTEEKA